MKSLYTSNLRFKCRCQELHYLARVPLTKAAVKGARVITVDLKAKSLKTHLARKSKSQNWLAKRLGISSGYMSQLMNGVRRPSPEKRAKILETLGGSFDDWFVIRSDSQGKASDRLG